MQPDIELWIAQLVVQMWLGQEVLGNDMRAMGKDIKHDMVEVKDAKKAMGNAMVAGFEAVRREVNEVMGDMEDSRHANATSEARASVEGGTGKNATKG